MQLYKQCRCAAKEECPHPWHARFKGKRMSLQKWSGEIVDSPRKAERIFKRFRAWVLAQKRSQDPPKAPEGLLGDVLDTYYVPLQMIAKGRSYEGKEEYLVQAIKERFGALRGSQIRLLDIEKWVFELRKRGCGPATIRRYIARLKAALNWMIARDLVAGSAPRWKALDLDPEPSGRTRRFLPEEEERVKSAASPWLRQVIDAALDTGLRKGALLGLRFSMVDLERGLVIVPRSLMKNKKSANDHVVPLTQRMKAIIEFRRMGPLGVQFPREAWVFGSRVGSPRLDFRGAWQVALTKAGVARDPKRGWSLHFHDLRGEFASRLHEAGVPIERIAKLLDHSTLLMTQRYVKIRTESLVDAIEKLEALNARLAIELVEKQRGAGKKEDEGADGDDRGGTIH